MDTLHTHKNQKRIRSKVCHSLEQVNKYVFILFNGNMPLRNVRKRAQQGEFLSRLELKLF